ncbi:pyrroloquinoline quinone biosynthesis peptide chaperone PqqD [Nocardia sp. CDC159]|uniref:Pyrroloquinoline quinone biosynthesis peptide chaperone PqqD n=1 Tax=Nocardia pulmonis TaxID=2951408 RepID=A0A9X2J324_9NOCA|nr:MULTISPECIES: pyrroloquinoline quinone biosynthesis peptide chaperone PqqD [Nocardia]MCM6778646.1 pyrroloquinoline quinone biosynthesis peptide chaperone PqqD [Nocardia pulmonis]MCM6791535.1 pyrroloquinoline quinone biosynthesis peptide chaperone PqqD [Nocardia sp. CDC159]
MVSQASVPRLRPGVRLTRDPARGELALLPEGVVVLNDTAAAVLARCDGASTVAEIVARLAAEYDDVCAADVTELLDRLARRRVVALDG